MTTTILDGETYPDALQRRYSEEAAIEKRMNIIELAKEAGFSIYDNERRAVEGEEKNLKAFAALVRAEREWIDLTDDEIHSIYKEHHAIGGCWTDGFNYERAVIAAFKAKQGEEQVTDLPIDEMLLDLRSALEVFNDDPSHESFAEIQIEVRRIEWHCEELIVGDEE